jgi:hypothetical protein
MRLSAILTIFSVGAILIGTSCNKQDGYQTPNNPGPPRKIQFRLYTDHDFTGNSDKITFTLTIQTAANKVLWDSVLSPMKISEIPDAAHKLVIDKLVPNNNNSLLKVGFLYSIENVGNSWFYDSSKAGETLKIVDFNFQ